MNLENKMNLENLVRNFQSDPENEGNNKNLALLLNRLGKFEEFITQPQYLQNYRYFKILQGMALFLKKDPLEIDIKNLPKGEIVIEFGTEEIAEQFGFHFREFKTEKGKIKVFGPDFDDIQCSYSPTDEDVIENTSLEKDEDDQNWLDADGNLISKDITYDLINEIKSAFVSALDFGTEGNANKAYTGAIEDCLEHFSDYDCDYDFNIPDEEDPHLYQEEENIIIKATGITKVKAFTDIVIVTANTDLLHIINNYTTDDGYDVYQYLDEHFIEDYIWSNFGILHRSDGFGSSCNDYDWDQEFDSDHFEEGIKEIEEQYEVRIL